MKSPRLSSAHSAVARGLFYALLYRWYPRLKSVPGANFDRFGRRVGWSLIRRGPDAGRLQFLIPVSLTRYFEFDFAWRHIPPVFVSALDVSSPRLFAMFVAKKKRAAQITMLQPDTDDLAYTQGMCDALGIRNIRGLAIPCEQLPSDSAFDVIWSISVLEHISGTFNDSNAIQLLFDRLRPGGRLIVTVPVDRTYREVFRPVRDYPGQQYAEGLGYFFERRYDETALHERLIKPLCDRAEVIEWYGELVPGRFNSYEQACMRGGSLHEVEAYRENARYYRQFQSFRDMPGFGVCGFVVRKPA